MATILTQEQIERVTSRLDFSGTLTVGMEICPVMVKALGRQPTTPREYVQAACTVASRYRFAAFACWPFQIEWVSEFIKSEFPKKQMVVNFPYGVMPLEMAVDQMKWGLDRGAEEIDSVLPVQYLQAQDSGSIVKYVSALREAAEPYGVEVKSIIRVADLMRSDDEVRTLNLVQSAGRAVVDGGGAFVKTCTGWADGKATVRIIRAIKEVTEGTATRVKASGGITCIEDALVLMDAGADRVAGRWPIVLQLQQLEYKV